MFPFSTLRGNLWFAKERGNAWFRNVTEWREVSPVEEQTERNFIIVLGCDHCVSLLHKAASKIIKTRKMHRLDESSVEAVKGDIRRKFEWVHDDMFAGWDWEELRDETFNVSHPRTPWCKSWIPTRVTLRSGRQIVWNPSLTRSIKRWLSMSWWLKLRFEKTQKQTWKLMAANQEDF